MYGTLLKPLPIPKLDKLRVAAQHYHCVLCGKDKRFTVAAHCDDVQFKGIGKKSPGCLIAFVCGDPGGCHDAIDGKTGLPFEEKRALWDLAFKRTVLLWFVERLVTVA